MSNQEYKEIYFEEPEDLAIPLESEFPHFAANELRKVLTGEDVDSDTVVAVYGVASLYGFTKVSAVLKEVVRDIRGRLVVFFPGEFENNNYRLLDARDGWNYLAIPITLHNGVSD
nr:BREX protein BrxB domain-containing protein [Desulfofundulus thermobenzoicus]